MGGCDEDQKNHCGLGWYGSFFVLLRFSARAV